MIENASPIQLSVVIVNYNVKYFLEQCLISVLLAGKNTKIEVFVVDNASVDGSCDLIRDKFPEVNLIENEHNVGFSKANNQAIAASKGKYVLLLNPDTLVQEDTFDKVVTFMDAHPDAGGLGVKMIDGHGEFLPESKRAFPSPIVAFYKMFGLTALFPTSKRFSKYHLGYLSNDEVHEIEVLSGAFMLLRKSVLDEIGLLDETFFMYGEDIDLSYRIVQSGYKNYYFPNTSIIHYKGESTKKGSINYVLVFYKAMIIFAKKHLSQKNVRTFTLMINAAIYLRAFLAIVHRFFTQTLLPLIDGLGLALGLFFIVPAIIALRPESLLSLGSLTLFTGISLLISYLFGAYDRPFRFGNLLRAMLINCSTVTLFGLLPEYEVGRLFLLLGANLWLFVWGCSIRLLLNVISPSTFKIFGRESKRYLIVGSEGEVGRIVDLMKNSMVKMEFHAFLTPNAKKSPSPRYIGTIHQILDAIKIFRVNEVVFSASDVAPGKIMDQMTRLVIPGLDIKIAPPSGQYLIGSHTVIGEEDIYRMDENRIDLPRNKRLKRIVDWSASILILILSPLLLFISKKPFRWVMNALKVLAGRASWIGPDNTVTHKLNFPKLKQGIYHPPNSGKGLNEALSAYWRDYHPMLDIRKIWKKLGQDMRWN